MDLSKHNRTVPVLCPTCAGTSFIGDVPETEEVRVLKCATCGFELTEQALVEANAENVDVNLEEMKAEILKDVEKQLQSSLKKAFSGNKNIRFK